MNCSIDRIDFLKLAWSAAVLLSIVSGSRAQSFSPGGDSVSKSRLVPVAGRFDLAVFGGDGLAATEAGLSEPGGVVLDSAGNVYIADTGHNRIRMVCAGLGSAMIGGTCCTGAGIITTIAGNGSAAYTGDGGPASEATLNRPVGLAVDGAGNLYIADSGNNAIRMIVAATGIITTIAGNSGGIICGEAANAVGDGCAATEATLNQPQGIALDAGANLFIADTGNHRIREVQAATGEIVTVAGSGLIEVDGTGGYNGDGIPATSAELNAPHAVAFDSSGNLYVADTDNHRIREVMAVGGAIMPESPIVTFAGNGRAAATACTAAPAAAGEANLRAPMGIAIDREDNVFIAERQNAAIRKVNAATGLVTVVARRDCGGFDANDRKQLRGPTGLFLEGKGNLYVADSLGMAVVEIETNSTTTTVTSGPNPSGYGQNVVFTVSVAAGAATGSLTGTISITDTFNGNTATLASGLSPDAAGEANFTTAALGVGVHSLVASYSGDAAHSTSNSAALMQTVLEGTATMLSASANPSAVGQRVTYTAAVSIAGGGGVAPDGRVGFYDGANLLNSQTIDTSGIATYSTAELSNGLHQVAAVYSGDAAKQVLGSRSAAVNQIVQASTAASLSSRPNPSNYGSPVALTVTVATSGTNAPTGTVTFLDNGVSLGAESLSGNPGVATFVTAALAVRTHSIIASYAGDSSNAPSVSTALNQQVNPAITMTTVTASPNPGIVGTKVTLTAAVVEATGTATPAGIVTFTAGSRQLGSATLSRGQATITPTLAAGNYAITASYAGDLSNLASVSQAVNETVDLISTTTSLSSSLASGSSSQVVLTATVANRSVGPTPGGTITYTSGATQLGVATLDANGAATLMPNLAAGVGYTITAVYSGDGDHAASTSSQVLVQLAAATFNLGLTPSTVTVKTSENATVTVSLNANGNFADTIGLGCGSLPAGVTCHFGNPAVALAAGGSASVALSIESSGAQNSRTFPLDRRGSGDAKLAFAGLFLPVSAGCGWIVRRRRKRIRGALAMTLFPAILAGLSLATGCGGYLSKKAVQSYVIQVTATGASSGMIETQNLTLTIQQ